MTLKDASPEKLLATLKHDNMFWRKHAQRLLVESGNLDVMPELIKLVNDQKIDEIGLNVGAIHALWVLHGLNAPATGMEPIRAMAGALRSRSSAVRRNAALVMPRADGQVFALALALADEDAQVRLAALLGLAEGSGNRGYSVGSFIADALCKPENHRDAWLADGITAAAAKWSDEFLERILRADQAEDPRVQPVVAVVAEHYARGGPQDTRLFNLLLSLERGKPAAQATILTALAKGWPKNRGQGLDASFESVLTGLAKRLPASQQANLVKLATAMGSKAFAAQLAETAKALLATATDEAQDDAARLAAARQVIELSPSDDKAVVRLLASVTPRTAPQFAVGIMDTLAASQAPTLGVAVMKNLRGLSPTARAAALRVLLGRPESTRALLDGLEKGQVQLAELSLDQKQALAAHPDKAIAKQARALLERGGGLPSADRQKVIEQLNSVIAKSGDAKEGRLVFKKHCAVCHTHSGEGQKIGPDLTGMAVHPRHELLVQIMDPSRSVEGNYRLYQVVTEDGKVMNGLLASESKTALEIYDAEGKKHVVQRDNVNQLIATAKSLMPDGFEKQLKENELLDLLEFLTQRGKFLPLPLGKVATAVSTRGMFFSEDAQVERLIFKDWGPKTFDGVPFHLVDPEGERVPNVILFYGPQGKLPPKMPKSVSLPCNAPAKAIHFLSGVSGWGYPYSEKGSVTLIVRLHYADGKSEDHPLKNGEHFADYIRRVDVPGSKFAFALRGQQIRYLAVIPQRPEVIERIELVRGQDTTAPVVMAVTVETR